MNSDAMRERILGEIKHIAVNNGGKPPGKVAFARATGITEYQWSGVLWSRWSEALKEAGYSPNILQHRFDTNIILEKIVEACRHYGRMPTIAEFKLSRLRDPTFPSKGAIAGHFSTKAELLNALSQFVLQNEDFCDVKAMLPNHTPKFVLKTNSKFIKQDSFVYLIKSGVHYKVGRSDELERRIKEIRLALPEAASLAHVIRTDDAPGIEAYWHRRFADRRANGEWFKLTLSDVTAFKRRKFQ